MFLPYHYLYLRIENGNYSRLQFLNRDFQNFPILQIQFTQQHFIGFVPIFLVKLGVPVGKLRKSI